MTRLFTADLPTRTLVAITAAIAMLLGAYLAIVLTDHDPAGFVAALVSLLGVLGFGIRQDVRNNKQDTKLETISQQTNGLLDRRIHEGTTRAVRAVLLDAGIENVADPGDPVPPYIATHIRADGLAK